MTDHQKNKPNQVVCYCIQEVNFAIDLEESSLPEWLDEDIGDAIEM